MSSSIAVGSDAASNISMRAASNVALINPNLHPLSAQFREIHKNTWLKRLTAEGKKITVGPKKSERSWVVFCVHDDTEAMLEGYAEQRQAPAHCPEWVVSLRHTLHVSHALIPNSHEFEFVVALNNEVVRFHATSWEIMQEWVETLRAKLREMKILSPRENLYTKLPEIRMPLLPTRDPTSPLPAPPPVPAALVPGVERVMSHNAQLTTNITTITTTTTTTTTTTSSASSSTTTTSILTMSASTCDNNYGSNNNNINNNSSSSSSTLDVATNNSSRCSMTNTLTQNLLNMLTDPISTYSEHLNSHAQAQSIDEEDDDGEDMDDGDTSELLLSMPQTSMTPHHNNSIRVDINTNASAKLSTELTTNERFLPRLRTSRSLSTGSNEKSKRESSKTIMQQVDEQNPGKLVNTTTIHKLNNTNNNNNNVTELQIDSNALIETEKTTVTDNENNDDKNDNDDGSLSNITIIEVSATHKTCDVRKPKAEFFQFPDVVQHPLPPPPPSPQQQPVELNDYKCNVQIIPSDININNNNYNNMSRTFEVLLPTTSSNTCAAGAFSNNAGKITTVHVVGEKSMPTQVYGTCYNGTTVRNSPQMPKRIVLTANTSGITNITVNDKTSSSSTASSLVHCDSKRNGSSTSSSTSSKKTTSGYYEKVFLSSSSEPKITPTPAADTPTNSGSSNVQASSSLVNSKKEQPKLMAQTKSNNYSISLVGHSTTTNSTTSPSRAVQRERTVVSASSPQRRPAVRPALVRGVTEAVIMRASRRDVHVAAQRGTPLRSTAAASALRTKSNLTKNNTTNNNNNGDDAENVDARQSMMQRRRSASTSDTRNSLRNSEQQRDFNGIRMQPPPQQRFGNADNNLHMNEAIVTSPKRLTLREQQVMQLRREISHPGGVRLQLRRKDCVGSIAWVDCFSTVWVAGWKQKEHPVLYNALHIGDQLLSVAGVAVNCAAEANKIIRNANTLFVEVLVRRIPFGRGYAIRRDREGQCLGLIRDGNTSTIVDVVPNSLAARHGLPPKAQSCDGSTLTFWMLTEINGRTLNLFFKENEIRDRLNSVGRDISILVQPADLVTKLKKQLKSMRGYKDYLVQ